LTYKTPRVGVSGIFQKWISFFGHGPLVALRSALNWLEIEQTDLPERRDAR
jgi:hypothetical protein